MNKKTTRKHLNLWTIYEHPRDAPEHYVLRRWEIIVDQPEPREASRHATLEEARAAVPLGLIRMARYEQDDPTIVETYI